MGERDKGDIYTDALVRFLRNGTIPDSRIGTVTGNSMKPEPYDPQVVRQIADERTMRGSRGFRLGLRRAS